MPVSALHDRVILITGAGRGLGRALALAFAARGSWVAANDISPVNLDETLGCIRGVHGLAQDYVFDITRGMAAAGLVQSVVDTWGRIDVLLNCARVQPAAAVLEMDEWDWLRTLDVNLTGPFLMMQQTGRVMRARGFGLIFNFPARPPVNAPGYAAYASAQAGLAALSKQAADELQTYGIQIITVPVRSEPGGSRAPQTISRTVRRVLKICEDFYLRQAHSSV